MYCFVTSLLVWLLPASLLPVISLPFLGFFFFLSFSNLPQITASSHPLFLSYPWSSHIPLPMFNVLTLKYTHSKKNRFCLYLKQCRQLPCSTVEVSSRHPRRESCLCWLSTMWLSLQARLLDLEIQVSRLSVYSGLPAT